MTQQFESSVNSEGIEAEGILVTGNYKFESSVNSEGIEAFQTSDGWDHRLRAV